MYSNYFDKLKHQAHYLDDGIEKLNETWKLPSVHVGCFGNCTEGIESHIEAIWDTIQTTQNGIEDELLDLESMEQLLQATKQEYESLKEVCDNLETVYAEHGYHYDETSTSDPINASNDNESNQHLANEMESLEVEFTPNLKWKCKPKQSEYSTPLINDSCKQNSVLTPVVNNLSILSVDTNATYKNSTSTPLKENVQKIQFIQNTFINRSKNDSCVTCTVLNSYK